MYTINGVQYAGKKEVPALLHITPRWARTLIERGLPHKTVVFKGRRFDVYPVEEAKAWFNERSRNDRPKRKRKCGAATPTPASLCWDCQRAAGADRCCWADKFEPVPGWEAVETKTMMGLTSYAVKNCPAFLRDKKRRP